MEIFLGFLQKFPIRLFRALASVIALSIFIPSIPESRYQQLSPLAWIAQGAETIQWDQGEQWLTAADSWLSIYMPGISWGLLILLFMAFIGSSRHDKSAGPGHIILVDLNSHASATFWYIALLLAYAQTPPWQIILGLGVITLVWCIRTSIKNHTTRNAAEAPVMAFISVCLAVVWLPLFLINLFFFAKSSDSKTTTEN